MPQTSRSSGMSGISLQQYSYFLSAVEYGSLSAAADANYIAQPSLSEQIRRMERALGVSLFVRTNRKLILTDAARTLIPHAESVLAAASTAVQSVAPIRDLTGGTVTFGTFSTARHLFHKDLVKRFRQRYPEVGLRLIGDNSVKIADEIREGRIEAGIVALPVDDSGLEMVPLDWSPRVYLCSSKENATSQAEGPKTMQDIVNATLIMPEVLWGDSDPTRRRLMEIAQAEGLKMQPVVEVSPLTALQLAVDGVGETVSPYPLAEAMGLADKLCWAPIEPVMRENFAFVKRRNATLSPGVQVIQRLIRQRLATLPVDAPVN
ncbi:MAG TPA: LysR family transcriptional regulator [Candidatus Corynebacterium avicola]|uniref:LysR family transcriptional regulator n=1 Tax=Candidatus Corynebacterium avicola TaxID=2838527 RepID=A0A9D1RP17_9CORY|nr:LysR family transcriptional regulator [Candidatus Corynebacterium avicola]